MIIYQVEFLKCQNTFMKDRYIPFKCFAELPEPPIFDITAPAPTPTPTSTLKHVIFYLKAISDNCYYLSM